MVSLVPLCTKIILLYIYRNILFFRHTLHYLTECCGLDYAALTNEGQNVLHLIACDKKDNNQEMLSILLSKPQVYPAYSYSQSLLSLSLNSKTLIKHSLRADKQ